MSPSTTPAGEVAGRRAIRAVRLHAFGEGPRVDEVPSPGGPEVVDEACAALDDATSRNPVDGEIALRI